MSLHHLNAQSWREHDYLCAILQVISSLLLNLIPKDQHKLNLISKSKINPKVVPANSDSVHVFIICMQEWGRHCKPLEQTSDYNDDIMSESEVSQIGNFCGVLIFVLEKNSWADTLYGNWTVMFTCYIIIILQVMYALLHSSHSWISLRVHWWLAKDVSCHK